MSLFKEVLLSCFLMMHIFFIASQPTRIQELQSNLKDVALSLCTLRQAEMDYVKIMFAGEPPNGYKSEPLEGISEDEIQISICSITDYLENHMPKIITLKRFSRKSDLFLTQFEAAASKGQNKTIMSKTDCRRNVTTAPDYEKKTIGLRILYFTRKWVEHFGNFTCEI